MEDPTGAADADRYLLANRRVGAGERLAAIADLFDPVTTRHLAGVGIGPGWSCWEVGAGGPGMAAWMAGQVGPTGRVVASDIDCTWLGDPGPAGVTVVRHDVTTGPVPGGPFDLIHARLLLVHLPDRSAVAATLASALAPGGWLVLEDADPALQPLACSDEHGPEALLANRVRAAFRELLAARGADLSFGRTLPRLLRGLGLVDVEADAYFPVTSPVSTLLERSTVEQLRDELVSGGRISAAEIDRHLEALGAGTLDLTTAPLVSARGRRPSAAGPPSTA